MIINIIMKQFCGFIPEQVIGSILMCVYVISSIHRKLHKIENSFFIWMDSTSFTFYIAFTYKIVA